MSQTCLYNISYKKSFTLYLQVAIEGIWLWFNIPYSAKFSRGKIFAEINFTDQGFLLATPSTISSQSQQRHSRLLASRFWLNFV